MKWLDANSIAILLLFFPIALSFLKATVCVMKHWSHGGIKHAYTLTHLSHFI